MSKFRYSVRELETSASLADYVRGCVDVPKFLACCEQCPSYKKRWSCPPYGFDPMDVWRGYTGVRFCARMLVPDTPGQDVQAAMAAMKWEKGNYLGTPLLWIKDGVLPEYLMLVGALLLQKGKKDVVIG